VRARARARTCAMMGRCNLKDDTGLGFRV